MKKRLLAFFLCLTMLLPLALSTVTAAEEEQQKILYASYGTVVMDGLKDDSMHINLYGGANNGATMSSAMFGAVWNENTLYIAMSGEVINSANHRGRALAFDRGYVTFENGASIGIEANGTVTGSEGVEVVKGASMSVTQKDIYTNKAAMHLFSETEVSRSVPYAVDGEVFFDLFVTSMAGGYTVELQSSYTRKFPEQASPVRIRVNEESEVCYIDGKGETFATGLKVNEGANKISVRFNGKKAEASVTVNGETAPVVFNNAYDVSVCFVHMRNGKDSDVSVDCFGLADFA